MNELGLLPFILVCILSILFKVLNAKVKMTMLYRYYNIHETYLHGSLFCYTSDKSHFSPFVYSENGMCSVQALALQ